MFHVTENIYVVGRSGWGGLKPLCRGDSANVFLIDGGDELALVDCGMGDGIEDILTNVSAIGKAPAKIRKVLLTHAHWDHCGGIAELLKRVDARIYGHRLTRETLAGGNGIY